MVICVAICAQRYHMKRVASGQVLQIKSSEDDLGQLEYIFAFLGHSIPVAQSSHDYRLADQWST